MECTAPPEEMPSLLSNRPSFVLALHLENSLSRPSGPKSEEQHHEYPATAWSPLASPSSSPTWVEVALSSWASSPWLLGRGRWSRSGRTGRCYVLGPPRPELRRISPVALQVPLRKPLPAQEAEVEVSRLVVLQRAVAAPHRRWRPVGWRPILVHDDAKLHHLGIGYASVPVPLSSCGAFGTSGGLAAEGPARDFHLDIALPELTSSTTMAGVGRTHFGNGLILS